MNFGWLRDLCPSGAIDPVLREMIDHVEASDEIFRPSKFWKFFEGKNLRQLSSHGLSHFKRTLNQNYFNWVPCSVEDNQFRALLALTAEAPRYDAFNVRLGPVASFQAFGGDNPLSNSHGRAVYRLFLGMLWVHAVAADATGVAATLEEPKLGHPIPARLGRRLISQDLANSVREYGAIRAGDDALFAQAPRIVEIGAGYGRLAYVFLKAAACRYVIVDIPPALYVSQWYLSQLFPDRVIVPFSRRSDAEIARALDRADVAFLTPDQYARLPDSFFDCGIAISNLAEMTPAQCALYLELFAAKVRRTVYIKQWASSTNEYDGRSYERADFDMPAPWRKSIDRLDRVQDRFFETVWRKGGAVPAQ